MLVLTRKINESIIIGSEIEVKIARIDNNQVRVGIIAPRYIPIYRKEIACSMNNTAASSRKVNIG